MCARECLDLLAHVGNSVDFVVGLLFAAADAAAVIVVVMPFRHVRAYRIRFGVCVSVSAPVHCAHLTNIHIPNIISPLRMDACQRVCVLCVCAGARALTQYNPYLYCSLAIQAVYLI